MVNRYSYITYISLRRHLFHKGTTFELGERSEIMCCNDTQKVLHFCVDDDDHCYYYDYYYWYYDYAIQPILLIMWHISGSGVAFFHLHKNEFQCVIAMCSMFRFTCQSARISSVK